MTSPSTTSVRADRKKGPCPCHSGVTYATCCGPFHRRERTAPDPVHLMRSRYAAFALGEAEYLWETLAESHPDRGLPALPMLRALATQKDRVRYMRLEILESRMGEGHGQVLFYAGLFERGADRSFVELSEFVWEAGGWRYGGGSTRPLRSAAFEAERSQGSLTIDALGAAGRP